MDQQKNQNNQNKPDPGPKNRQSLLILLIGLLGTLLIWSFFTNIGQNAASPEEIDYSEFLQMLEKDEVASVELESNMLTITPREQKYENIKVTYKTRLMEASTVLVERLSKIENITFKEKQPDPTGAVVSSILSFLIPFVILIVGMNLLFSRMSKGGGMMGGVG